MSAGKKTPLVQPVNIVSGQQRLGKWVVHPSAVTLTRPTTVSGKFLLFLNQLWILGSKIWHLEAAVQRDLISCLHPSLTRVPHSSYSFTPLPYWFCLMVTLQPGKVLPMPSCGILAAWETLLGKDRAILFAESDVILSCGMVRPTFLNSPVALIFCLYLPVTHTLFWSPLLTMMVPTTWQMPFLLSFSHLACSFSLKYQHNFLLVTFFLTTQWKSPLSYSFHLIFVVFHE